MALRRFAPEQRSAFLRFIWGRARLPASLSEWGDMKMTIHTKQASQPDGFYPVAHTCFFQIDLPRYSSKAVLKEKLLYALYNCKDMDLV